MKRKANALFKSLISLILCFSMLVGTTFAWFTDSVKSGINTIAAGNLDVELYHTNAAVTDERVNSETKLFMDLQGNPILWEPGVVSYENLRVANEGDLALAYQLAINTANENFILDPANNTQYGLSQILKVGVVEGGITATDRAGVVAAVKETDWTTLATFLRSGSLLPVDGQNQQTWGVVIYWQPGEDDNRWNLNNGKVLSEGETLQIDLGVKLVATQEVYESDAFGDNYDTEAKAFAFPNFVGGSASAAVVPNDQGQTTAAVTMDAGVVSATVPAGAQLAAGVTKLTLNVSMLGASGSNITLGEDEAMRSLDVHVDGLAENNTVPVTVTLKEAAPKGLNMGNYKVYHVEKDGTKEMTLVDASADFTAHNQFKYDPATGDVTLYMATFSEVAVVADTENAWEGEFDYTWYDADAKELTIANADQLAAFGAIVGGMNGQTRDSFAGKSVKLIADINLGDAEDAEYNNGVSKIFYPIGYYYNGDSSAPSSTVYSFGGTFDGNGHTIGNFYQNTWEIKGDYDGNYYKDAMGLFGYVYGGTIKNLTVDHFSSDGEYTPTGSIAAYAAGDATFENIAITNCNPRVYNTGNGGIIGIAGDTSTADDDHITLKNITVDNSNKISALWGSWDVACGGLVGMYRGNVDGSGNATGDTISFDNCHVSAQIDVYNDVCANYQYYAYRYAGMIIGSVRHNTTNAEGKTIPNMTGISATGCTVHFGTWNDYYYCEIIDNTTASYTHDYQMSRLTEIKAIDGTTVTYLDGTTGTVPASGRANYVIVDYTKGHGTENATCYHFKDGAVWTHDMGGIQPGIDENGDGQEDLREDKQHLYLEFNNLFTGYGWGVSSMAINKWNGITALDVTTGDQEASVEKFETNDDEGFNRINNKQFVTGQTIFIGDLFREKTAEPKTRAVAVSGTAINKTSVQVFVSPVGEDSTVSAEFKPNKEDWKLGILKLEGKGDAKVTITDYNFCIEAVAYIKVIEASDAANSSNTGMFVKFTKKFADRGFTYKIGNQNSVAVETLFDNVGNHALQNIEIQIKNETGNAEGSCTEIIAKDWQNSTITFTGIGKVKVTISADGAIPVELELEVVDAVNATGATSATANNVVLLNDCGFSSLEVSGGYTLYGNGFTMTCSSDSAALDTGYAFVTLKNGTLDNVQIECPNFDYAVLYSSNMTESGNRSVTTDKTRYYNVKSGVMASGNSRILNSRISGGRAAVNITGGNVVIDNSRIELGAVASVLIGAANEVTLKDVTLVQKPTASTYEKDDKPANTLMGFSVLSICDAEGNSPAINLEGKFIQNAWIDEEDKKYVPSAGQSIVSTVLGKADYLHDLDGDGKNESLNLGIAYMPESLTSKVNATTINDNRTNKNTVPYDYAEIYILSGKTYVYSYKNTNGTDGEIAEEDVYVPDSYGDIIAVTYADTKDGLTEDKSFEVNGWVYELNVDLDKLSGYALDFSKLTMSVNGVSVTDYQVNGETKPATPVVVVSGGVTYTLTATINGKEYTAIYKVTGTETSKDSPTLVASNYAAGLCVASSSGGTWHGAAPALQGIQIRYWSVAEKQYMIIDLADYTPTTKGKLNGTNTSWTYSPDNGDFTLTLTGGQVHSKNNVYAMPVCVDTNGDGTADTLYFVASSSNGLVNSGNSARTVPVTYSFKDNNNGDVLTFSHTWSVEENKDNQYKYSDFCNGTYTKLGSSGSGGSSSGCVTGDTLITLADGTQKRADELTGNEQLLVWNLETGKYDTAPIVFVDTEAEAECEVIDLYFSNGSKVSVIYEHGFFDYDLGKYVYLDASNAKDYIGHKFVTQGYIKYGAWSTATLVDVVIEKRVEKAYSPVTFEHLCYYTDGMLSMPGGIEGLFNIFDVNAVTMTYDAEKKTADIEKYGLLTLEDFGGMITEDAFNAFNGEYLNVAIGKGLLTWEDIAYMAERYIPLM